MVQSFRPDGKIRVKHFVCGNHPISLHLEEAFLSPQELIDLANEEIERNVLGELDGETKVNTLDEAVAIIKKTNVVFIPE
jgi:hypothetical protein